MIVPLVLAIASAPRPVVVTLVNGRGGVRLLAVNQGKARVVAEGSLQLPSEGILDVVSDGRHVLVLEKRDCVTAVWLYRVSGKKIQRFKKLRAPGQVGALSMTGTGKCYAGSILGQVVTVWPPSRWKQREGMVARSSAQLRLSPSKDAYAMVVNYGGMSGILSSCVFAGRCDGTGSVKEIGRNIAENDAPFEDAAFLPSHREILTVDGTSAVGVSLLKGGEPRSPERQISLLGNQALRLTQLRGNLWALVSSDGSLSLGRFDRDRWKGIGPRCQIPGESKAALETREANGQAALIVASRTSGAIYWLPFRQTTGFGRAHRIYSSKEFWPRSISY